MRREFRYPSVAVLAALFVPTCSGSPIGGAGGTGGNPHDGGICVQNVMCLTTDHWDSVACRCVPNQSDACNTDSDCRTFADYCTGCDCRALAKSDLDPVCSGPGVRCFADPCLNKSAVCVAGKCQISPAPTLKWYATCGDPVCRGYTPQAAVPLCTPEQMAGAPCTTKDQTCDPQSGCNSLLRCTDTNPAVVCPISSRRFKDDIEYVDGKGLERLASEVERMKLARYHYKADAAKQGHLGFIIEDQPNSPAVERERDRVDLYGYTSMAVAALQVQSKQLKAQKQELEATARELSAIKQELQSVRKAADACSKR